MSPREEGGEDREGGRRWPGIDSGDEFHCATVAVEEQEENDIGADGDRDPGLICSEVEPESERGRLNRELWKMEVDAMSNQQELEPPAVKQKCPMCDYGNLHLMYYKQEWFVWRWCVASWVGRTSGDGVWSWGPAMPRKGSAMLSPVVSPAFFLAPRLAKF